MAYGKRISGNIYGDIYIPESNELIIFSDKFKKSRLFESFAMHARIEETPLRVPEILKVFQVDGGRWGILQENIKGKSLAEYMQEQPEQYDEFLEDLADYQIKIHEISIPELITIKEIIKEQLATLDIISEEKKEALLEFMKRRPSKNTLCHGDFGPQNIIITEEETVYYHSWVYAFRGEKEADVAKTYLMLSCSSTETAESYLKIYCEKSKTDIEDVRAWLPVMAASQLATGVVSMLQKELMLAWLDMDLF